MNLRRTTSDLPTFRRYLSVEEAAAAYVVGDAGFRRLIFGQLVERVADLKLEMTGSDRDRAVFKMSDGGLLCVDDREDHYAVSLKRPDASARAEWHTCRSFCEIRSIVRFA